MLGLLSKIETLLDTDDLSSQGLKQIASYMYELDKAEEEFRVEFMQRVRRNAFVDVYSTEFYNCVADLVSSMKYDTAISEAFRRLDKLLQCMCAVEPHRHYGEELINLAFAEKGGRFQLGTDPNEQRGLRNLYSGSYALFRNVSVHRSLFGGKDALLHEDWEPEMLIAFISLLEKIAIRLFHRHLLPKVSAVLAEWLPALAGGLGWHEDISGSELAWSVYSRRTDSSRSPLDNFALRCRVTLHETGSGFEWKAQAPRDLYGVVKGLIERLAAETNYPISRSWYEESKFLPLS